MTEMLRIAGGTIYDPANNIDGEVRDLWIRDGRIVAVTLSDAAVKPKKEAKLPFTATRTINATGLVILPGGIDMHCHIAGPKVNAGRQMSPEDRRTDPTWDNLGRNVPTTHITGYKYAGLGYTTAFDAAISPLSARQAHLEFADTPCIDSGCYLLVADHQYLLEAVRDNRADRVKTFLAWLLGAARGYAPKLVNPGGIETWKRSRSGSPLDLDAIVDGYSITPRQIISAIADATSELQLPHPMHIHCNNLGLPGNWTTTLETMKLLAGRKAHLTHIQFHSYAGGDADEGTFGSRVEPLVSYFNEHSNLSIDVGQILFGPTTSMTGDSAVGYYLSRLYKTRWYSHDVEVESGCGVSPIEYKQKSVVHAWQWAIGLEWFLLAADPWRVALSTDHPNGGSFTSYPRIIRLLMDAGYRREMLAHLPRQVREQSLLRTIDREYTLREIAIITRAAPARLLGLTDKGHLGVGAEADITIYTPDADRELMFQLPRYVLKSGVLLIDNYERQTPVAGKQLWLTPQYDTDERQHITDWMDRHYTIRAKNYAFAEEEK
ncbi:MAG: formylmethanofuran dehydrogenase subunit A [Planctomycetota bacterium]|nr:formylmethanofuran dehydrogenase subunit A [Planctomycetota bacterium]